MSGVTCKASPPFSQSKRGAPDNNKGAVQRAPERGGGGTCNLAQDALCAIVNGLHIQQKAVGMK